MTKFSRPRSWVDHRLADALEIDGSPYTVELVARRATGTAGFRMTVVFLPHERTAEGRDVEVEVGVAGTTADIHQRVRELSGDAGRLRALYHEAAGA